MGEGFFIPRTGVIAPDIGIIGFFSIFVGIFSKLQVKNCPCESIITSSILFLVLTGYNSRIFNPLQTSGIFGCGRTFFYDGILELLVLLAQLLRDGLKKLEYVGLVLLIRILYHIVFVGANNISLHVQHFIQSFGVNEGLHHIRHTAQKNSSKSNGLMSMVVSYPTGIDFGSFP